MSNLVEASRRKRGRETFLVAGATAVVVAAAALLGGGAIEAANAAAPVTAPGAYAFGDIVGGGGAQATKLSNGGSGTNRVVACPAIGDCVIGGAMPVGRWQQAEVADQVGNGWARRTELAGIALLSPSGMSGVNALSCPSAGNCVAGGYADWNGSDVQLAFLAVETDGVWAKAFEVPGMGSLTSDRYANLYGLSCDAVGDCAAGGFYVTASGATEPFVVSESGGAWGTAIEVPGTAVLNVGGVAEVDAISCAGTGDCTATGRYESAQNFEAYAVTESAGVWSDAKELPDMASLNATGDADAETVSCWAPGSCATGGYVDSNFGAIQLAFVDSQLNGTWAAARYVPGLASLTGLQDENAASVSCDMTGSCTVGGFYRAGNGTLDAFVDRAMGGTWGAVQRLPGPILLDGESAGISSMYCSAAGDCVAGGWTRVPNGGWRLFDAFELAGVWGDAVALPTPRTPETSDLAYVDSVSCVAAERCVAAGYYEPGADRSVAIAVNLTPPRPSVSALDPTTAGTGGGRVVTIRGTNFDGASRVGFGAHAARSFVVLNLETIRAVAPGGSGVVDVVVTTPFGRSAADPESRFAFQGPPTIRSIVPTGGDARGGTVVVIRGLNLVGTIQVAFGTHRARSVVVLNPDAVRVATPSGRGAVRVTVSTPEGRSRESSLRFHYRIHLS